jgi:hypothetical protein
MWQEQLISIVEGNSLDPDHIADLLITYEAETGDKSLRGCGEVLMLIGALRHRSASGGSRSGSRSRCMFGSKSGSLTGYWSRSRSGFKSWFGSGSSSRYVSWFGSGSSSRSGFRTRSLSGSRSK